MVNILYISYDGLTDSLGQSQILPYLIGLSKHNYSFTIISLEKWDRYEVKNTSIREQLNGLSIEWIPIPYNQKPGIFTKTKNNKKLSKACFDFVKSKKVQLIHSRSYPASIIAQKISSKNKIPFLFDMRGFWADERIEGNIWSKNKPIHKFLYSYFKRKEKLLLTKASQTISLTHAAKKYLLDNFNSIINPNNITVIPCCTDLVHFNIEKNETNKIKIRKELNLAADKCVVIYLGSIGTWYLLSEMLDFFKIQLSLKPNSVFLLVTQNDHEFAQNLFRAKQIPESCYKLMSATREEVPGLIQIANYAMYFIKPSFSKIASSPVKLGEIMACGIPVIANGGIGDVDIQAQENNQLLLVKDLNEKSYLETINKFSSLKINPEQNRIFAIENFSLEIGIERYRKVYEGILEK